MDTSFELNLATAWHGDPLTEYLHKSFKTWRLDHTIQLEVHHWEHLWGVLRGAVFKQNDIKIAEVGTTWLGSLVGMRALRSLNALEIAHLGGSHIFIPAAWDSLKIVGDFAIYAVPWLTDTRILYYWRDMLEDAGLDEQTAFQTPEQFDHTLATLQAKVIPTPLVLPTIKEPMLLHNLVTWIWAAGGDFLTPDYRSVAFNQPDALKGALAHFQLHRYLPHPGHPIGEDFLHQEFLQRRAAVTLSGSFFRNSMYDNLTADQIGQVGMALPPGPSFVGGSHLAIMDSILPRQESRALELIAHLINPEVQRDICQVTGMLPARADVLNAAPFTADPYFKTSLEALKKGRSLPTLSLWGTIEERLIETCSVIWAQIMDDPEANLEAIVRDQFNTLARRINTMLAQ